MKKLQVCRGPHCTYRGSDRVFIVIQNHFAANPSVIVERCACTGFCEEGPNVVENDSIIYHHSKPKDIVARIEVGQGEPIINPDINQILESDDILL